MQLEEKEQQIAVLEQSLQESERILERHTVNAQIEQQHQTTYLLHQLNKATERSHPSGLSLSFIEFDSST